MYSTGEQNERKRTIDISSLQDYKINTNDDWINWKFDHEEHQNLPLGFNNKFNLHKNVKFCDLHSLQQSQEDEDFLIVQENIKKKDKGFISKNVKINEYRQVGNPFKRSFNKKQQRNFSKWTNQIKTNFKKITVKNNWKQLNTITKNSFDNLPQVKNLKVQNIKTIGNINYLNPQIQRTHWQQKRFKQTGYTVDPIKTASDKHLMEIAMQLLNDENSGRFNIICNPTFLLALLTVRAAIYPWNIQIQKVGNSVILQSFKNKEEESQQLNYLDLFNINENTLNNMPLEESRLKQNCIVATKMTKIFQDLLASGEQVERQEIEDQFPEEPAKQQQQEQGQQEKGQGQQQQEQGQQQEKQQQLTKIRKYLKISLQKIDIYTYVEIDGAKKNSTTGQLQYFLIRTFMENQTQGVWVKNMTTTGSLITKQYQSNICSLQKWICQAHLAGVKQIKTGFIGYTQNKALAILNVDQVSVKGLQNTMSQFKYEGCWGPVKYIFNLLAGLDDGKYALIKSSYTPLTIKLYLTSASEQETIYEQAQEEDKKQQGPAE